MAYPYSIPEVSKAITDGKGKAGNAIRGWYRQGRVSGVHQREKNAKIWLNAEGVREVWELWANHRGLDAEADMPEAVRKMIGSSATNTAEDAVNLGAGTDGPGGQTSVHFQVKPGSTLTITVTAAA